MFDPFPLPPCNAFGGPPMETTDDDPGGAFAFNAACNRIILSALDDGHHEGDPAPVIGWGESVKRNVSDYLRRREAIAAGEKDPGPKS